MLKFGFNLLLLFSLIRVSFATNDSLLQVAIKLEYDYPDSAIAITQQLLLDEELNGKLASNVWEVQGIAFWVKEDYGSAIEAHRKSLEIRETVEFTKGVGYSYNNLGLNYQSLGDATLAMENFLLAQEVAEQIPDSSLLARVFGNIGTLYEEEHDEQNALAFYGKSLSIVEKLNDGRMFGNTLNNIALVYKQLSEPEKAENFGRRSLTARMLIDDKWGLAQSLNFLGLLASDNGNYQTADSLFRLSLNYYQELNNHWGQSMVYGNLGADANAQGNYHQGVEYCGVSLSLAKQYWLEWEESACECLAESYSGLEQADEASYYWKRLVAIKDSTREASSLAEISEQQKRFEFEKEQIKAEAEIERQKSLRKAAFGLGMMGIALFFLAFRSYQTKQRDNELLEQKNNEITEQKSLIEEKNLHITDSIRYAQNLQSAILPKEEMFSKHFSEHHILYQPKDIVSGDFYWMEEAGDKVFLAVADCTGHGVPGAMVSMVGFQGLNKAVMEEKLTSPAAILQRLSDHVEEAFEKSGGSVKDGMDICLVCIDPKKRTVTYSGAHNALWVLTEKELQEANLREEDGKWRMHELKADRRSIGGYFDAGPFTECSIELNEGDRLFLFSDGFADQFGGPNSKKMGSKRMRNLFREKAVAAQFSTINAAFEKWKGLEEQIDDVTVISVVL